MTETMVELMFIFDLCVHYLVSSEHYFSNLPTLWPSVSICNESSTVYSVKAVYNLVGEYYANEGDMVQ